VPIDFTLPNQDGNQVSTADYRGKHLIIFFYPAAMTAGCTVEACDFRDNYSALQKAGYELVGVSPDPPARNKAFQDKEGLPFPLLSDEDHQVAESLGAWGTKKLYGKEFSGLIRSTFVLDPEGNLEREYRAIKAKGHVSRLTADLAV
jgi:peroxiredoxin Q/BCP